jgi:hypothetical protein
MLIEGYSKFMKTRTRYFHSPALILVREGFHEILSFEKDKDTKTLEYIKDYLKIKGITSGHIVWRTVYNGWGFPWAQVWYRKEILDKYFNKIETNQGGHK